MLDVALAGEQEFAPLGLREAEAVVNQGDPLIQGGLETSPDAVRTQCVPDGEGAEQVAAEHESAFRPILEDPQDAAYPVLPPHEDRRPLLTIKLDLSHPEGRRGAGVDWLRNPQRHRGQSCSLDSFD